MFVAVHVNEFHARICDAQAEATMLNDTQKNFPGVCDNCSFTDYANAYYNLKNTDPERPSRLPLLILAAILSKNPSTW